MTIFHKNIYARPHIENLMHKKRILTKKITTKQRVHPYVMKRAFPLQNFSYVHFYSLAIVTLSQSYTCTHHHHFRASTPHRPPPTLDLSPTNSLSPSLPPFAGRNFFCSRLNGCPATFIGRLVLAKRSLKSERYPFCQPMGIGKQGRCYTKARANVGGRLEHAVFAFCP